MRRAFVLVASVLLAACSSGGDADEPSAFPAAPAACAGDPAPADAWTEAVEAAPDELWIGFARTLSPGELARTTAGLRLSRVVVDGTVVPVTDPRPATVVGAVQAALGTTEQSPAIEAARLAGEPEALGRFVSENECLVQAIGVGDEPPG